MTADTLPDWITEGAKVAMYANSGHLGGVSVTLGTVERLTNTQIVIGGRRERRFRRSDLCEVGDRNGTRLYPTSDRLVQDAIARSRLRALHKRTDELVREAILGDAGRDAVLATLDQIAEAVASARAAIDGSTR